MLSRAFCCSLVLSGLDLEAEPEIKAFVTRMRGGGDPRKQAWGTVGGELYKLNCRVGHQTAATGT